ncbi:hypothetical protein KC343_g916 [Hortaea werneckii]|uniref:Isochorismatase-like domain-containing protein n=1 Tax=Hortaea werneckii TaxID=91943 RepID=A0A3M7G7Q1_HORWE|nr:hypothetical protein KC342_g18787 [Hortaea werneckii]KAI6853066.1 hypothetical protein KC350_g314 [Hortaea werneckii]KAI7058433.1 hypothetical protein KC339_g17638 [Hortaea werneckii]KAI7151329.1 hypothetical protein KC349_g9468 [Hortaea werneckii]KAI7209475.1 hypothetical protein KC365_g15669 [Hortaea werneckii]
MFLSVQYGLLLGAGLAPLNTSYTCHPTCIPSTVTNNDLVFDGRLAFLNLDPVNAFVEPVAMRHEGREWISSVKCWIEALHDLESPLIIFTRPYFSSAWQPELGPDSPFRGPAGKIGTAEDVKTMIYPSFHVKPEAGDVVLQKTGYSAGTSNSLEQILLAQSIDTVVLSGIRTGGAVASTAYRLFDLGYTVYIIANNTIETEDTGNDDNAVLLSQALPKLPVDIITLNQALRGLK